MPVLELEEMLPLRMSEVNEPVKDVIRSASPNSTCVPVTVPKRA